MMKYISLLLLVLIGLDAQSQVVINMQLPPSSIYLKNQLWNLSLVNAGSDLSRRRGLASRGQLVFTGTNRGKPRVSSDGQAGAEPGGRGLPITSRTDRPQ